MLKVIVADDDEKMRKFIKLSCSLEALRLEIAGTASNGVQALNLIKETEPDILITDIRMPDCDGITLIEKAKAINPNLEIVIISGYANFECARTAINYGISSYLLKPVTKQQVYDALQKCVENCLRRRSIIIEREQLLTREGDIIRLRAGLVHDLLDRHLGTVNPESLCSTYHFHVKEDDAVQVIMLKICCGSKVSRKTLALMRKNLADKFKSEAGHICHDIILEPIRANVFVVVSLPKPCVQRLKALVINFYNAINTKCGEIIGGYKLHVAMGPVEEAANLTRSFEKARYAMAEHLVKSSDGILEEIPPASDLPSRSIQEKYMADIMHAVDVLSIEAALKATDLLEERAMAVPNVRGRELKNLVYSAAGVFIAALAWNNIDFILEDFFKKCDRCSTSHQLFETLKELQTKIMSKVAERLHTEDSRPIKMAKQYVRDRFAEPVTLEETAKVIGFSGSYFSALFKKQTGIGFNQYLIDVRMEKAKEFLQNSDDTVTKICRMVGYSDLKHFNRVFKRETGMTPGQYRKIHRENLEITI